MNNLYYIIIDLDGTLLWDFNSIDKETFDYLKYLKSLGHKISIATGRPLRSSKFVYDELDLDTLLINYNGALISNPSNNQIYIDLKIDKNSLFNIYDFIKPHLINLFCEVYDTIYLLNKTDEIIPFLHLEGSTLFHGNIKEILNINPHSGIFFVEEKYVDTLINYVNTNFSDTLHAKYWGPGKYHVVEVYNKNVDKSNVLEIILNHYQIPLDHIIAFGDAYNDLGLLSKVGISVGMKNGSNEVLSKVKYITDSNTNQGVLKFLKNFFDNKNY